MRVGEQRNRVVTWFLGTLGGSCIVVGVILLAWSVDRERLYRRMNDPTRQP
jgi:hypothetical protein